MSILIGHIRIEIEFDFTTIDREDFFSQFILLQRKKIEMIVVNQQVEYRLKIKEVQNYWFTCLISLQLRSFSKRMLCSSANVLPNLTMLFVL